MNLPPFEYMTWAKTVPGRHSLNLAVSGVRPLASEEFPFDPAEVSLYGPDPYGLAGLVEAIARAYDVEPDWVLPVPGTSMANFVVAAASLSPGDEALVETPAYPILALLPGVFGANVRRFERGTRPPLGPRTRLVVVTHLHNPTGLPLPEAEYQALAAMDGPTVLVDEVYRDFLGPAAGPVAPRRALHLVSTGSLTKAYGLPGLRLGWILARPDRIARMRVVVDYLNVIDSFPAMSLGVVAFRRLDALWRRGHDLCEGGRRILRQWLSGQRGIEHVWPPAGTIVFLRFPFETDPLVERLRAEEDAVVVPGRFFGDPHGIRIGIATDPSIVERGRAALGRVLATQ